MQAEVIDYTAEVLSRRLLDHMNRGDWEEAQTLSALIEGYLDGLWTVTFKAGVAYRSKCHKAAAPKHPNPAPP